MLAEVAVPVIERQAYPPAREAPVACRQGIHPLFQTDAGIPVTLQVRELPLEFLWRHSIPGQPFRAVTGDAVIHQDWQLASNISAASASRCDSAATPANLAVGFGIRRRNGLPAEDFHGHRRARVKVRLAPEELHAVKRSAQFPNHAEA